MSWAKVLRAAAGNATPWIASGKGGNLAESLRASVSESELVDEGERFGAPGAFATLGREQREV
ncbi:hypothetical protein CAL65_13875 [Alkalilimnicola ehrlichii]|uniref:Uncharacterized protein n=1 Tax=Alkalilimnicola ehrlichii TaxID=351052 RepID=A0A3E0WT88_9GAMM|nr:hypothetical protein CAL65_13875 [Alkalilimnicola ehrlichii]